VNDHDGEASRIPDREDPVYQGFVRGVAPARAGQLAEEGDTGRDAISAEPALEPGRVTQLADSDRDRAVSLLDDRPGRQLGAGPTAGLVAGWGQRGCRLPIRPWAGPRLSQGLAPVLPGGAAATGRCSRSARCGPPTPLAPDAC